MPLYIGDYLADTAHLNVQEHGAYLLLIMHYWTRGGLPEGDEAKMRICRLHGVNGSNAWRSICLAIAPFFDENWRHKRIDKELEKVKLISEKRSYAGRKGGLVNRGFDNVGRVSSKAIAKQRDGHSHSHSKSYLLTSQSMAANPEAAFEEAREGEGELVAIVRARGWAAE